MNAIESIKANCGLIILAGGQSRRMGQPKASLTFKGTTFIEHIYNALHTSVQQVYISSQENYPMSDAILIQDEYQDCGPLGGLHASLKHSAYAWNWVVTCDTPLINSKVYNEMSNSLSSTSKGVVISVENKTYPLIGIYHRSLHVELDKHLKAQNLRVMSFVKEQQFDVHIPKDEKDWKNIIVNINTPMDYNKLVQS